VQIFFWPAVRQSTRTLAAKPSCNALKEKKSSLCVPVCITHRHKTSTTPSMHTNFIRRKTKLHIYEYRISMAKTFCNFILDLIKFMCLGGSSTYFMLMKEKGP
jgi:hypothetical protein